VTSPLKLTTSISFQPNTCFHSPYVTSSLMRGWVCSLRLLLALAIAVILRFGSRGTQNHILVFQIRDCPQPGGPGPHIYIPQEQGGSIIPPGTGFPFHCLLRLAGLRWRYSTLPPHWTDWLILNCLLLLYSISISMDTPVDHLYPISMDMSGYHTAMGWFPRIYLHGSVFCWLVP
jgi:hypothetical protein